MVHLKAVSSRNPGPVWALALPTRPSWGMTFLLGARPPGHIRPPVGTFWRSSEPSPLPAPRELEFGQA
jgi:hypothetical protein